MLDITNLVSSKFAEDFITGHGLCYHCYDKYINSEMDRAIAETLSPEQYYLKYLNILVK